MVYQVSTVKKCKEHIRNQDSDAFVVICTKEISFEGVKGMELITKDKLGKKLEAFFSNHPIKSFDIKHEGGSKHGTKYIIGSYVSQKGERFMMKFKFHKQNGELKVSTIKFSPE